jgi:hypothetical protein
MQWIQQFEYIYYAIIGSHPCVFIEEIPSQVGMISPSFPVDCCVFVAETGKMAQKR